VSTTPPPESTRTPEFVAVRYTELSRTAYLLTGSPWAAACMH
jgi:hypothetical protein